MTVVHDTAMPAVGAGAVALERHQRRATEQQFQPGVVQPHAQTMADQLRWEGVAHSAQPPAEVM